MKIVPCCPPYNPHLETQIRSPTIFDRIAQECSYLHVYPPDLSALFSTTRSQAFSCTRYHSCYMLACQSRAICSSLRGRFRSPQVTRKRTVSDASRAISTSMTWSATYITGFRLPAHGIDRCIRGGGMPGCVLRDRTVWRTPHWGARTAWNMTGCDRATPMTQMCGPIRRHAWLKRGVCQSGRPLA